MAYTNKYILKADIHDLETKLKSAEKSYTQAMDAMGSSTKQLTQAQKDYEAAQSRTASILKAQADRAKDVGVKAAKEEYAEKLKLLQLEEQAAAKEVTRLKKVESARKRNVQLIKEGINASKDELASHHTQLATLDKVSAARKVDTKAISEQSRGVKQLSNDIVRHIRHLESYFVAIYAIKKGYEATLGTGHEFNKLIEQETIGLKLLISQNLAEVDSKGKAIDATKRYVLAQTEAAKAIDIVRKINVQTPHSFRETLQIFKLLTPQVLKLGGSLQQTGEITQRMSVIAASMGIEFQQFLKTVDSALSGEMLESGLKRALEQFGVTNAGIKEVKKRHGDVVGYVINGLRQAEAAGLDIFDSWGGTVAQFKNEWDEIWGEIQKPVFDLMKTEIKDFTKLLKDNKKEIEETVKFIGSMADDVLALGGAYFIATSGAKALSSSTGFFRGFVEDMYDLQLNAAVAGANITKAGAATTILGRSLKGLAVTAGPMLALFAAWEAWSYVTDAQNRKLEETNEILSLTRTNLIELTEKQVAAKRLTLLDQLGEIRRELKGLPTDWERTLGIGPAPVTKERTQELRNQEASILAQMDLMKQVGDAERTTVAELKSQKEIRKTLNQEAMGLATSVQALQNVEEPTLVKKREELQKHLDAKQKELAVTNDNVSQLEATVNILGGVSRQYKQVASDAEAVAEATAKAATAALQFKQSLLQGQLTRREISEESFIEQKLDLQLQTADQIADLDEQYRAEVKAFDEYETSMHQLRLKQKEDLYNSEFSLLERNGTTAEKIAKKKQLLELQGVKGQVLENRLREYALSLEKQSNKEQDKKNRGLRDEQKILGRIKDEKKKIEDLDKALSIRNSTDFKDIFLPTFVLAKKEYETAKRRTQEVKAAEKGDQGRLNTLKAIRKEKEAELKLQQSINESIEAYGSFIVDITSGFKEGKGLNEALSNIGPQIASTMQQSENVYVKSAGYALQILGNLLSSTVSEAQIKAATGRSEWDDESIANLTGAFENAQYPLLDVTNTMAKYLRGMNENFGRVALAITGTASTSGIDLTGVNFVETMEAGFLGFSSKSVQLLGTGLQFELQNLADMMDAAEIAVRGYTSTLVHETSWWGLVSDTDTKISFQNLPASVRSDLAESFAYGYGAILTAGVSLGLDELDLESALKAAELNIGKVDFKGLSPEEVSQRLSQVFGEAMSGVVDGIEDFSVLVDRYATSTENSLETLGRIALEYDQASHQFGLIGKTFADGGLIDVTKQVEFELTRTVDRWGNALTETANGFSQMIGLGGKEILLPINDFTATFLGAHEETWTEITDVVTQQVYTAQMQILDIVESAGGQQAFTDAMGSFMTNFFTEEEQLEFMTKSMQTSFATLGLTMPSLSEGAEEARAAFKDLLYGIDTTTEEGSYLFGQVLTLADGFAQMTRASEQLNEETSNVTDSIKAIADAWLGNMSYLTLQQKAEFASGYLKVAAASQGALDTVEAARLAAETAMRTSTVRSEYIPAFERYIRELEKQVPDATNRDLLNKLEEIKNAVVKGNTITEAATYRQSTAVSYISGVRA